MASGLRAGLSTASEATAEAPSSVASAADGEAAADGAVADGRGARRCTSLAVCAREAPLEQLAAPAAEQPAAQETAAEEPVEETETAMIIHSIVKC